MFKKIIFALRTAAKRVMFACQLMSEELYWFNRCIRFNNSSHSKDADLSTLLVISHVLEKGITMPNRRLGFGYERVRLVIDKCSNCISKYGNEPLEIQSALTDLNDYLSIHNDASFKLPEDIVESIKSLLGYKNTDNSSSWSSFTPNSFFRKCDSFGDFADSRHTCRYFSSEPVDISVIINCIKIAQRSPSACNRQSTKVHIITTNKAKEIVLKYQNGSRGFGQDADKFLLITAEQSAWDIKQSKSAYIDAGLFTMTLLYALHENKVCACTLNAHIYSNEINNFYREIGIPKSEIPIVFIAIGNAKDNFLIAKSERVDLKSIYSIM